MNDFPLIDRRNNPPMPLEEYERQALERFARGFALTVLASLLFAGIVYPWSNAWVCAPFVAAFLVGAWMLAGRRQ